MGPLDERLASLRLSRCSPLCLMKLLPLLASIKEPCRWWLCCLTLAMRLLLLTLPLSVPLVSLWHCEAEPVVGGLVKSTLLLEALLLLVDNGAVISGLLISTLPSSLCYGDNEPLSEACLWWLLCHPWPLVEHPVSL